MRDVINIRSYVPLLAGNLYALLSQGRKRSCHRLGCLSLQREVQRSTISLSLTDKEVIGKVWFCLPGLVSLYVVSFYLVSFGWFRFVWFRFGWFRFGWFRLFGFVLVGFVLVGFVLLVSFWLVSFCWFRFGWFRFAKYSKPKY